MSRCVNEILYGSSDDDEPISFNFQMRRTLCITKKRERIASQYGWKLIEKICGDQQDSFITSSDDISHPRELHQLNQLERTKKLPLQDNTVSSSSLSSNQ